MSLIAGNLAFIQRLLDEHQFTWAVCAGAAAHLYGNRRPIQDVDILVTPGKLPDVVTLLKEAQKMVQFDGKRIMWRGIKLFDDLSVLRNGLSYPFRLDQLMSDHLQRLPLLGAPVAVLAPEDVLLHKLLLDRGVAEGKHDHEDAEGIVRRQTLDGTYLHERIRLMRGTDILPAKLTALGVATVPI